MYTTSYYVRFIYSNFHFIIIFMIFVFNRASTCSPVCWIVGHFCLPSSRLSYIVQCVCGFPTFSGPVFWRTLSSVCFTFSFCAMTCSINASCSLSDNDNTALAWRSVILPSLKRSSTLKRYLQQTQLICNKALTFT